MAAHSPFSEIAGRLSAPVRIIGAGADSAAHATAPQSIVAATAARTTPLALHKFTHAISSKGIRFISAPQSLQDDLGNHRISTRPAVAPARTPLFYRLSRHIDSLTKTKKGDRHRRPSPFCRAKKFVFGPGYVPIYITCTYVPRRTL